MGLALIWILLIHSALFGPHARAEERAYELVSPTDKNGALITLTIVGPSVTLGVAPDGEAVAYGAAGAFPGAPGGSHWQQYVSTRSAAGWSTRGISPPLGSGWEGSLAFARVPFLSGDLTKAVVSTPEALTPDAAPFDGSWGLYLRDDSTTAGTHELLGIVTDAESLNYDFGGASEGLDHIVFSSQLPLASENPPNSTADLYEWADGELRLAGILPNGETPAQAVFAGARDVSEALNFPGGNPVSADGSRIYFTAGGLYLREDAAETKIVSASERVGDDSNVATTPATFLFATTDGSVAFFSSPRKLTDDATASGTSCLTGACDLYRWEADAPVGDRLTDLTTQDPAGGGLIGDVAATDDASYFYFVASGELAPGAQPGGNNLYLWRPGDGIRHVATLAPGDADRAVWDFVRDRDYRDARIAQDGSLLFASRARLTSYDNAGHRQIYLYDPAADELTCVSCNPMATSSSADAEFWFTPFERQSSRMPLTLPRNLSADGSRAFFQTEESLVREDTNGKIDVYEWEAGNLELVSDGTSPEDAGFIGASADGDDVFFITRARLVAVDRDGLPDVYDARVGGGFPEPPTSQPCLGDECQGPAPVQPPGAAIGSSTFTGVPGNAPSCVRLERRANRKAKQAERAQKRFRKSVMRARRLGRRAQRASGDKAIRLAARAERAEKRAKRARRAKQGATKAAEKANRQARRCMRGGR